MAAKPNTPRGIRGATKVRSGQYQKAAKLIAKAQKRAKAK